MPLPRISVNSEVLKDIMARERLGVTELALRLDVDPSVISRAKNGHRGSPELLFQLQKMFPDRAADLAVEHREITVTTNVAVQSE